MKLYFIWHANHNLASEYTWDNEMTEIQSINPDKIIIFCMEEFDVEYIFRNLFPKIVAWCNNNDKYADLIAPGRGAITVDRITMHESIGHLLWSASLLESYPIRSTYITDPSENISKLYTCYNHNVKIERAKLVDRLARDNLLDLGTVTLHYAERYSEVHDFKWQYHDGSTLVDEPDYTITLNQNSSIVPARQFFQGYFDVTTESSYSPNMFLMSEKCTKNIATLRPFIVLSCKGFHYDYMVKRLGFELYDELFDYSFDNCDSLDDRIEGIVANVNRLKYELNTKSKRDSMYKKIARKLAKNHANLRDILHNKELVIPECLKFMTETDDYEIYGFTNPPIINHMRNREWIK